MLLDGTQATRSKLVTPSDAVEFETQYRGFYVGVSGTVRFTTWDGDDDTWTNVAAGMIHAVSLRKVWETGTTAGLDIHVVR